MRLNHILFIIFLFFISHIFLFNYYKDVWWDSAVYIGMGKYSFSNGNSGLWEGSRPLIWPLILGFTWKIGLDAILVGRIIEIALGGACILLAYLIGKRLFNDKIALLASLLLAVSPTFFFFNGIMLTEIVSTFFALLGLYLFTKEKYYLSGAFFGLSFMTRFLQLFIFILLVFLYAIYKKNIKNLRKIAISFSAILMPYLILNFILYNNPIHPFEYQLLLTQNSGWFNYQPFGFYFVSLFKENFLYLLAIVGVFLAYKSKNINKKFIASAFILLLIFFSSIKQKEMRFLIIFLPYMYILISASLFYFINKSKGVYLRKALYGIIAISLAFSIINIHSYYKTETNKTNKYQILQNRFLESNVKGNLWISNPMVAVFSDKKISNLMYYPFLSPGKNRKLIKDSTNADFIFLDSCDLGCGPDYIACVQDKNEMVDYFKGTMSTEYSSNVYGCKQFIFKKFT